MSSILRRDSPWYEHRSRHSFINAFYYWSLGWSVHPRWALTLSLLLLIVLMSIFKSHPVQTFLWAFVSLLQSWSLLTAKWEKVVSEFLGCLVSAPSLVLWVGPSVLVVLNFAQNLRHILQLISIVLLNSLKFWIIGISPYRHIIQASLVQ